MMSLGGFVRANVICRMVWIFGVVFALARLYFKKIFQSNVMLLAKSLNHRTAKTARPTFAVIAKIVHNLKSRTYHRHNHVLSHAFGRI